MDRKIENVNNVTLTTHRPVTLLDVSIGGLLIVVGCAQQFFRARSIQIFTSDSAFLLCALWGCSVAIYGVLLLYANTFEQGYLPDSQTPSTHRSFLLIGLCNTVAHMMELASFDHVPITLQATFGHLSTPFLTAFTLVANPSFLRVFSTRALCGAAVIVLGAVLHMGWIDLANLANMDAIFFITVFFLAQIPTSWGLITQQQYYAVRRINVYYFLFYVNCVQFVLGILSTVFFSGLTAESSFEAGRAFFSCLTGQNELDKCRFAPWYTAGYVGSAILGHVIQISLVRLASYQLIAVVMLGLPTAIFVLFLFPTILERPAEFLTWTSIGFEVLAHFCVLLGAAVYRLDPRNGLDRDFVARRESLHGRFTEENLSVDHTKTSSDDLTFSDYRSRTTVGLSTNRRRAADAASRLSLHHNLPLNGSPTGVLAMRSYPSTVALPMYTVNEDTPPLLRPVLMNTWSGSVPCEYTDYKREFDLTELGDSGPSAIQQYTLNNIETSDVTANLRKILGAYKRRGSGDFLTAYRESTSYGVSSDA